MLRLIGIYYICIFFRLMVYRNFFMYIMQMVTVIRLYFGNFIYYLYFALLKKIYINIDEYWVDIIINNYKERPAWIAPIILTY